MSVKPFFSTQNIELYQGDCLEIMPQIESASIDAIICDLPYGITACKWDSVLPLDKLWEQYKRVIKPGGAIVLFSAQPFTSALLMSNPKWFKYELIWQKNNGSNFASVKYMPFKEHENILIFCNGKTQTYNPIRRSRSESSLKTDPVGTHRKIVGSNSLATSGMHRASATSLAIDGLKNPGSVLHFPIDRKGHHPTQKPIALLQYLIKTYTNPGDRILDNTAGSFSCGVAAILENRKFIGIEQEEKYYQVGQKRIEEAIDQVGSMLIKPWEIDALHPPKPITARH